MQQEKGIGQQERRGSLGKIFTSKGPSPCELSPHKLVRISRFLHNFRSDRSIFGTCAGGTKSLRLLGIEGQTQKSSLICEGRVNMASRVKITPEILEIGEMVEMSESLEIQRGSIVSWE